MSGVFRAIGKVFKGIVKVVKKVALPALMIGAVVLTGGAALGALPALGTILGSIGISGGLAAALGGAISAGAIGAGVGGLTAAVTGGNILKGATRGFVGGAITGGLMGAAGLVSANGLLSDFGIGSQAAHINGLKAVGAAIPKSLVTPTTGLLSGGIQNVDIPASAVAKMPGSVAPPPTSMTDVASAVQSLPPDPITGTAGNVAADIAKPGLMSVGTPGATTAASTPSPFQQMLFGGGSPFNTGLLGSALSGIGQGLSDSSGNKTALRMQREEQAYYRQNYGIDPATGQLRGLMSQWSNPGPLDFDAQPERLTFRSPGRFEYDPTTRRVIFVAAG